MKFANVSNIKASKILRSTGESLRPGQILRGKVLKLYPNNKADINLGGKRFIANLEVGLELGGRYHFQVTSTGNVLELKVLGEQLKRHETLDLSRLLAELGLRGNKHHLELLRQLTSNSIPFDKGEIQQAAQFLKGERNKGLVTNILVEMMSRKFPMTLQTFQSLKTSREFTLTDQLKSVIQQLSSIQPQSKNGTSGNYLRQVGEDLIDSISKLTEEPLTFREGLIKEITSQSTANNQSIFQSLRGLGFISSDVSFSVWANEWNSFNLSIQKGAALPLNLNDQELFRVIERIEANRNEFMQAVQKLTNHWHTNLQVQELTGQPLSKEALTSLREDIKSTLSPYLERNQLSRLEQIPNSMEKVLAWYRGIQMLGNNEGLSELIHLANHAVKHESFLSLSPKNQFLEQLSQTLTMLGMDYESRLASNREPQQVLQTIKGLLLQIGGGQEAGMEQQTRLLQHIQGLQLQSMNETQTMIQANLQVPAEKLGLVKDLDLEFEGKKNEKGEIDSDYCRILFYLELNQLGETVIDVNIQNRAISLTVFNNTEGLPIITKDLRNSLGYNLESLSYHLSSVTFKRLEEKSSSPERIEERLVENSQGVDFRI